MLKGIVDYVLSWYLFIYHLLQLLWIMGVAKYHDYAHKFGPFSFLDEFERKVDNSHWDRVQFISVETDEKTTIGQVEELANQVGNWGLNQGLKQMDSVALMMLNSSDYVALWLGFGKIGVSSALLNTNATGNALTHSCQVALASSETKILIVDAELKNALSTDLANIESMGISVYFWSVNKLIPSLKSDVVHLPKRRISRIYRNKIYENDPLLFVFTSGTTGLPKACKISQLRYFLITTPCRVLCNLTIQDRLYTVLPLYHSAGGLLGVGACLMSGACMVLRKKFSASNFTNDCLKYQVTAFQYIGELCRYLIAIPENERDKQLKSIKTACGNGMRPDVWEKFQKRYNINHIVEFYGATEGNAFLVNNFDKVGALGYLPYFVDFLYPLKIIRTEEEDKTKPLRDSNGKCVLCAKGEVGLLVAPVVASTASRRFEGYTDANASNAKLLKDVFNNGDCYFNSGDLLSRDEVGFYYWSDRIGDTFRWKGENVATTEVQEIVSTCVGVKDNTVYGVSVPGCDGRAGMAAIAIHTAPSTAVSTSVLLEDIVKKCKVHLPAYSRPLFLRVKVNGDALKTTATFKHQKSDLTKEGFNPELAGPDAIYYFNAKSDSYVLVTPELYKQILEEKIRF